MTKVCHHAYMASGACARMAVATSVPARTYLDHVYEPEAVGIHNSDGAFGLANKYEIASLVKQGTGCDHAVACCWFAALPLTLCSKETRQKGTQMQEGREKTSF